MLECLICSTFYNVLGQGLGSDATILGGLEGGGGGAFGPISLIFPYLVRALLRAAGRDSSLQGGRARFLAG